MSGARAGQQSLEVAVADSIVEDGNRRAFEVGYGEQPGTGAVAGRNNSCQQYKCRVSQMLQCAHSVKGNIVQN